MSNSEKKNRRPLSKSRLAAASQVAVEAIEARLLMTVAYSYVTDQTSYNIPAGQTQTVNVYLKETLTGSSTSIISDPNENGLAGAAFEVQSLTPSAHPSLITGAAINGGTAQTPVDFSSPNQKITLNNPKQSAANEVDLQENIAQAATVGVGLGNRNGAATNEVFLGALTITGSTTPGTTTFTLGEFDIQGNNSQNTITSADTDLDNSGVSTDGVAYTGVESTVSTFTVTTTAPAATVTVTAPSTTYTRTAYSSATTTVTGANGADNSATVTYSYYAGSLNATQVASATAIAAPVDAGTYTVVANFAGDTTYGPANSAPATFSIGASPVTATVVGAGKTYDRTTADTGATFTVSGVISGDVVTATGTAVFVSGNAGTNIEVDPSGGITLSGAQAGDYSIGAVTPGSANITAKSLTATVTGASKTYDGTTSDSGATYNLTGVISGDTVTVSGTAAFANASAGTNIEVDATGLTLAGSSAANYSLPVTTATGSANITAKSVTASVAGGTKVFDGTNSDANATYTLSGVIGSDAVTASGTATFASVNVANGIAVNASGITLAGAAATDYSLPSTTATGTGNITKASPAVTAVAPTSGTYTGSAFTATATVLGIDGNPISGVTATFVYTNTATSATSSSAPINAGSYSVVASVALTSNYNAAMSAAATFTISAAMPTVTVTAHASGTYTGSPFAATATVTSGGTTITGVTPTFVYTNTTSNATSSTAPTTVGSYSVVASIAASGNFSAASSTAATFSISKATPIVTVTASGASFTDTIKGANGVAVLSLDGVSLTLTYYAGSTATGTPLTSVPSAAGTYTVVATFAGSTNYNSVLTATSSNTGTYTIVAGAPVFPSSYTFGVTETPSKGKAIGTVKATPAFSKQTITYSLVAGGDASSFSINSSTGAITALVPLDLAVKGTFNFTVLASAKSDTGSAESATVPVTVNVVEVLPTITETVTAVKLNDNATDSPLSAVTIGDIITTHTETVTVTIDPARGSLKETSSITGGFTEAGTSGVYTLTGTPSKITTDIRALVYTPAVHEIAPGSTYATPFAVSVSTPAITGSTVTKSPGTTVTVTAINTLPKLSVITASQSTNDKTGISPFSHTVVTDPDDGSTVFGTAAFAGQSETVYVTENNATLGAVSGGGFTAVSGKTGVYSVTGTAAQVTADLNLLVFTPTANVILSGSSSTETLTVSVVDAANGKSSTAGDLASIKITPAPRITTLSAVLTNPNLVALSTGPKTPAVVARGIQVVTLSNNDPDTHDLVTYTLVSGTGSSDNSKFSVSSNKLVVNISTGLVVGTYDVLVQVTDKGGDKVIQALVVTIGTSSSSVSLAS